MNLPGLLTESLRAAVPVWREQIAAMTHDEFRVFVDEHRRADVLSLCQKGDLLLYGGGSKGEVAEAFNALARTVAALSFNPGGATFAGLHWCQDHGACSAGPDPLAVVEDLPADSVAAERYESALGSDVVGRKTTAAYYTPESLVDLVIESALHPVVDQALRNVQKRLKSRRSDIGRTLRRIDVALVDDRRYLREDTDAEPVEDAPLTLFGGEVA